MKKTIAWILLGTMMISTLQGINPKKSSAEGNITVERIAGKNRYETSALVSKKVYDTADSVLVASGEAFPDALAAGVFANENLRRLIVDDDSILAEITTTSITAVQAAA